MLGGVASCDRGATRRGRPATGRWGSPSSMGCRQRCRSPTRPPADAALGLAPGWRRCHSRKRSSRSTVSAGSASSNCFWMALRPASRSCMRSAPAPEAGLRSSSGTQARQVARARSLRSIRGSFRGVSGSGGLPGDLSSRGGRGACCRAFPTGSGRAAVHQFSHSGESKAKGLPPGPDGDGIGGPEDGPWPADAASVNHAWLEAPRGGDRGGPLSQSRVPEHLGAGGGAARDARRDDARCALRPRRSGLSALPSTPKTRRSRVGPGGAWRGAARTSCRASWRAGSPQFFDAPGEAAISSRVVMSNRVCCARKYDTSRCRCGKGSPAVRV